MATVQCQTCKGKGKIRKKIQPGIWQTMRCPARCDNGRVHIELI